MCATTKTVTHYVHEPPLLIDPIAKRKYEIWVDDNNEIQLNWVKPIPRDYEFFNLHRTNITHTTGDEFPRITQRLFDVHTRAGTDVMLEVRVRSYPARCEARWYLDDVPLTRRRPGNCDVREWSPNVFVLYIKGAQRSQSGVYSCTAYNRAGAVRTSAFVDVAKVAVAGSYLPSRRLKKQFIA